MCGVRETQKKQKKDNINVRHRLCGTASWEWKAGLEVHHHHHLDCASCRCQCQLHPDPVEAHQPIRRNHNLRAVRIIRNDDLCSLTLSSQSIPRTVCRRGRSARRGLVPNLVLITAAAALHERLMLPLTSREGERVEGSAVEVALALARCPQTAHPRVLFRGDW